MVLGSVSGVIAGTAAGEVSVGFATWASVLGGVLLVYALWALHAKLIAGWALRRAFGSLGLLLPLATRALPMLLLFITFLFINTEVWQVASGLHGGVLWSAVLFFILAALGFLVPRLAQELDRVDDTLDSEGLCAAAEGTPLEDAARRLCEEDTELTEGAEITGLQKVNLVTVLVVAQAVQVVLLALAVFAFFLVFGTVAIQPDVIDSWIGHAPTYPPGPGVGQRRADPGLDVPGRLRGALLHRRRDHRRDLPQGVLLGDPRRAPARGGRARGLPAAHRPPLRAVGRPAPPAPGG